MLTIPDLIQADIMANEIADNIHAALIHRRHSGKPAHAADYEAEAARAVRHLSELFSAQRRASASDVVELDPRFPPPAPLAIPQDLAEGRRASRRRLTALAHVALWAFGLWAALALASHATPWDIPDGNGGWEPNPSCSSDDCHSTGNPDNSRPDLTRSGNGRAEPLPRSVPAFKSCCIWQGNRFATPRFLRSQRTADRQCATDYAPPPCFQLTDPNPPTGTLK